MALKSLEKLDKKRADARGEGTRYALIMAGMELFGEHGVKATTTRMLAEKANANVSAIAYYFENKEGLYLAVVSYIAEQMQLQAGNSAQAIMQDINLKTCSIAQAKEAYHAIMDDLITLLLTAEGPKAWSRIVMREQSNPTEAFDVLYKNPMRPMQVMTSGLMQRIAGGKMTENELIIRSHAIFGQILVFLVSRETLLRGLNSKQLEEEEVTLARKIIHEHIAACLDICEAK